MDSFGRALQEGALISTKIFGSLLIIGAAIFMISIFIRNKGKFKNRLESVGKYILSMSLLSFFIIPAFWFIFLALNFLLGVFQGNSSVSSFLSLFLSLVILMYFPDKIVKVIFPVLIIGFVDTQMMKSIKRRSFNDDGTVEYVSQDSNEKVSLCSIISDTVNFFLKLARITNFKIWVYFIQFIFLLIAQVEKYGNMTLLHSMYWTQTRPIIESVVISVIALDRFLKVFNEHFKAMNDKKGIEELL